MAGLSPSSWVTGPAPPVETALPAAPPAAAGGRSSLLCPPSVWSPRPLWTALKDGCVARPPRSERPGHDAALDPHPGEPVPIPVPGRATSSKRRGSANKGRRRRALRWLLSWAVHASCSTTSGPPPGCTTRSGGSRATPWTCPGRQGRAISPTPTWFPHATMMSSRSARARMTVLAAHGTPPDGNSLHPPPSGPMGRQPTSAPLHSKRKTKLYKWRFRFDSGASWSLRQLPIRCSGALPGEPPVHRGAEASSLFGAPARFPGAPASQTGVRLAVRRVVHRRVGAGTRIHSGRSRDWRGSCGRSTLAE